MANLDSVLASLRDSNARAAAQRVTSLLKQRGTAGFRSANPLKAWMHGWQGVDSKTPSKPYAQSLWVYRCINVWAWVAGIPLELLRKDGREEIVVEDGPVNFLLQNPHPRYTQQEFYELALINLGLHGENFWLREDGNNERGSGVPMYLTPVSPAVMSVGPGDTDRNGVVERWTLDLGGGRKRKVPAGGVIHVRLTNPYDPTRGLSPVSALRMSIDADYAARQHNKVQMANRGRIEGIITYERDYDESQLRKLQRIWKERLAGSENAGAWAHLTGVTDVKQLSQSMKDLDWLDGSKLTREEICAGFGVAPPVVGILDHGTYQNVEQAERQTWSNTLRFVGDKITDVLQKEIVAPNQTGVEVKFDFENSVPALAEDIKGKVETYVRLVNEGVVSPERAAEIVGIDLGEIDEAQRTVWVQIGKIPADDALAMSEMSETEPAASPPPQSTVPSTPPQENPQQDGMRRGTDAVPVEVEDDAPAATERKAETEVVRAMIWRDLMASRLPWERRLEQALKKYFFEQRSAVLRNFDALAQSLKAGPVGVQRAKTITADEFVDKLVGDLEEWNKRLVSRARPVMGAAVEAAARKLLRDTGSAYDKFAQAALESYKAQALVILAKVNDTTRERLKDSHKLLMDGVAAGKHPDEIAREMAAAIRETFNATESRRRVIARTEIGRAMSGGRFVQMREMGITRHQWLSSRDDVVRDSHAALDGDVVEMGEDFANGLEYPMDPSGPPEETINCRCDVLPVTGDPSLDVELPEWERNAT